MRRSDVVVVRARPALRFGGAGLLGFFAFGIWWAAVAAVVTREPDWPIRSMHPGTAGVVVLWAVLLPCNVGLTYLTLMLLCQKQTFGPGGATVRKVLRTRRLPLGSLTKIEFRDHRVHTGTAQLPAERLLIHSGAGGRALLQEGLTHVDKAFDVVEGWVRLRPELVRGTNAERTFVRRGVLPRPSAES